MTFHNPAVVYNKSSYAVLKISNKEEALFYYTTARKVLGSNPLTKRIADNLAYMELPEDEELINKLMRDSTYLKELLYNTVTFRDSKKQIH